jgi:hypothetical protein
MKNVTRLLDKGLKIGDFASHLGLPELAETNYRIDLPPRACFADGKLSAGGGTEILSTIVMA